MALALLFLACMAAIAAPIVIEYRALVRAARDNTPATNTELLASRRKEKP